MAGGKETGRQKMIGMMYLVLTALLALNMSKEVLEAFVSIDSNVQEANRAVTKKANYSFMSLEEVAKDKTEPGRAKKAQFWMDIAAKIREKTNEQINFIDDVKEELLIKVGETPETMGQIVIKPEIEGGRRGYDLSKCTQKDKYDEPMEHMIGAGAEVTAPSESAQGMVLWNKILQYRSDLTSLMGSYQLEGGKTYTFEPNMTALANDQDYSAAHQEDTAKLRQIFTALTLKERADMHGGEIKDVHWVGRTFDHAPVVAAIAQLSAVQTTILNAEAEVMQHIRLKVGGGEYSFNKITALAYGQEYANAGDSVNLQILMAAYDDSKDPQVFIKQADGTEKQVTNVGNGMANYGFVASSSDTIEGRIGILNKAGEWKFKTFKKGISVGKPSGVVSLPEMNVLYKGYSNKVAGAASGFQTYSLSGAGCSVKKTGDGWVATVSKTSKAREASISITGKNADGASKNLGKFPFRVQPMPKPNIYLGNLENGGSYSASTIRTQAALFAKYGPGIPLNASFSVVRWNISSSTGEREISGKGKILSGAAKGVLKQAKKGSVISIFVEGSGPGGKFRQSSSIKVK
jgi:gliding motility-associated protein GldM